MLNERTQQYNKILSGQFGYTEQEVTNAQKRKEEIKNEINILNQIIEKRRELSTAQTTFGANSEEVKNIQKEIRTLNEEYKELAKEEVGSNEEIKSSLSKLNEELMKYSEQLDKVNTVEEIASAFETDKIKNQQKEAAQLKVNANTMKSYLDIIKKGDKSTTEYQNAVEALSKAYPEASTSGGMLIDVLDGLISAEQLQADEAWNASQTSIQGHIANIQQALADENVQRQVAANMGIAYDENFKPKLEAILSLLQTIGGYSPEEVPNIPVNTPKSSGGGSYSNKRLDNYKKEIEHKKAMDQISLNEEIAMYEKALRSYAKTTDEKRELREKIYELNKELAQKEKEMLDQQTEDYENYIEEQKRLRGAAYSVDEQTKDYNKIIEMHKSYLNQIMNDERLSLNERKQLYREELQVIKDYEKQKRDLRVETIDNTLSQLTNAITKKLEVMQEKDKEMIDKNLEEVEKWKNARIEAINAEYDARIEAIEKELEALDKAEKQKSRDEEDEDYNTKKERLENLIAFEHDEVTKANYQKELDKLVADYKETLDKRVLEDKKEALHEQKKLLQEEQNAKIEAIEKETEKRKEEYEKQLKAMEEYYEEQMAKAEETAQWMLLHVEQNQNEILELLQTYGDQYAITGQTFGEKLGNSFADTAMEIITNAISEIQRRIDSAIASNIARLQASASGSYSGGYSTTYNTRSVNVNQYNTFSAYSDSPSVARKKQETINRNLADSISRIF